MNHFTVILFIISILFTTCTSGSNQSETTDPKPTDPVKTRSPSDFPIYNLYKNDIDLFFKKPEDFPLGDYSVLKMVKNKNKRLEIFYRVICTRMYKIFSICLPNSLEQLQFPDKKKIDHHVKLSLLHGGLADKKNAYNYIKACEETSFYLRKLLLDGKKLNPLLKHWAGAHICAVQTNDCSDFNKCLDHKVEKYFSVLTK